MKFFISFLGDKSTELAKNVTKEHTIEKFFMQILGKEIELMKTLQGEIKPEIFKPKHE